MFFVIENMLIMDLKILVATHKQYWMPDDDIYLPVHVGKKNKVDLGYIYI